MTTKNLAKFQSPRAITRWKIIGPKRNVNLICNSSLYTHIPNIKSISPSIAKKVVTTKNLAKFQSPRAITRPKIVGPERNVNLICNLSSIHPHTKYQVNISKHNEKKVLTTFLFRNYGMTDMDNTICPGHFNSGGDIKNEALY